MAVDTAVTPVESTEMAGSVNAVMAMQDISVLGMFMHADIIVKAVMILLLLASFWSWAIMFDKYVRFKALRAQSNRFEKEFWSSGAIDKFYEKTKKRNNHPLARVFIAAMDEWYRSRKDIANNTTAQLRVGVRERVAQVMLISRNREAEKLENGLGFLATVGSSAPFVGLFGTVWGIMNSFTSIAAAKNITLAVVAPGIAEALLATAIGLFAAIPAVIGYNKFSGEMDRFAHRMEDFSTEFNTLLSRQLDSEGK
ncbi:MAG: protein TolQ [Alphaproteobacteria bacterium]|nr:protein TolQ [Alphaproteobacteria bacterium]